MKRKLVVVSALVLSMTVTMLAGCGKQNGALADILSSVGEGDQDEYAAEGPEVKHSRCEYANGDYYEYWYDEQGRTIKSETRYEDVVNLCEVEYNGNQCIYKYYVNDVLNYTETYVYDDSNENVLEFKCEFAGSEFGTDYGYTCEYDRFGNMVKRDGGNSVEEYSYSSDGENLLKEVQTYNDAITGEPISFSSIEYDEHYNVTHYEYIDYSDPLWEESYDMVYKYDDMGNVVRSERIEDGQTISVEETEYEYDAQGRMIKSVNTVEGATYITEDTYDGENLIESKAVLNDIDGISLQYWYVQSFDKEGRLVACTYYSDTAKTLSEEMTYTYNEDGSRNYKRVEYSEDGSISNIYTDYSDKYGCSLESSNTYADGTEENYIYEYDEYRMCTKSMKNGKVEYTVTYEYWD